MAKKDAVVEVKLVTTTVGTRFLVEVVVPRGATCESCRELHTCRTKRMGKVDAKLGMCHKWKIADHYAIRCDNWSCADQFPAPVKRPSGLASVVFCSSCEGKAQDIE